MKWYHIGLIIRSLEFDSRPCLHLFFITLWKKNSNSPLKCSIEHRDEKCARISVPSPLFTQRNTHGGDSSSTECRYRNESNFIFLTPFFMGLFSGLFKMATLPVSLVKDVVTLGGQATMNGKSYTRENCEEIDEAFRE